MIECQRCFAIDWCCILMMISIVIIIQVDSRFSYERVYFFLPSALVDTKKETQFIWAYANHTMLTPSYASCGVVISAGRDPNGSDLIRSEKLNCLLPPSYLNSRLFKIPKILRSSLPGVTSSTHSIHSICASSPIWCLGAYYN